jgi:hypothetical protein
VVVHFPCGDQSVQEEVGPVCVFRVEKMIPRSVVGAEDWLRNREGLENSGLDKGQSF